MAVGRNADMDDITSSAHRHLCPPPTPPFSRRRTKAKKRERCTEGGVKSNKKDEEKVAEKNWDEGKQLLNPSFFRFRFYFIDFPEHSFNFNGWLRRSAMRALHTRFRPPAAFECDMSCFHSAFQIFSTIESNASSACIVKSQSTIRKVSFQSQAQIPTRIESEYMFVAAVGKKIPARKKEEEKHSSSSINSSKKRVP